MADVPRITDDFNRANETEIAGNWATITGFTGLFLGTNRVRANGASNFGSYWVGAGWTSPLDGYSQGSLTDANDDGGPIWRVNAGVGTFYLFDASAAGAGGLKKSIAATLTMLAGTGAAVIVGDVMRLSVVGTSLVATINGATTVSVTDSAIDGVTVGGTNVGLFAFGFFGIDNFVAGEFAAPVVDAQIRPRFPKFRLRRGARP